MWSSGAGGVFMDQVMHAWGMVCATGRGCVCMARRTCQGSMGRDHRCIVFVFSATIACFGFPNSLQVSRMETDLVSITEFTQRETAAKEYFSAANKARDDVDAVR